MPYKDPIKQKEAQHKHYLENKKEFRSRAAKRKDELKQWFREITKDVVCSTCGEPERCCIDYHHLDPSIKEEGISKMITNWGSKEKILEELKKCVPLCSNCHRKVHAGILLLWAGS